MPIIPKTHFTGFSPNATVRDIVDGTTAVLFPWKWRTWQYGSSAEKIEEYLQIFFQTKHAKTFDSGRTALFFALQALGIKEGDEVLVQAYTCIVVTNAIRFTGATPVFVDVNDNYNINSKECKKKITPKTKAIIVQHTFGLPADIEALVDIAKEQDIKIIEDCAHAYGVTHNNQLLGTFGDISIFSFGGEKVVSAIRGGFCITNDDALGEKIATYHDNLQHVPKKAILQHLLKYPIFIIGKWLYSIKIGKILFFFSKKLHITSRIISKREAKGKKDTIYPATFPNILAKIALRQVRLFDSIKEHRRIIAAYYDKELKNRHITKPKDTTKGEHGYLRYTIQVDDPKKLHAYAKKRRILLGNWYNTVVAPVKPKERTTGYIKGSCKHAEKISKKSVNLPTNRYITLTSVKYIVDTINTYKP